MCITTKPMWIGPSQSFVCCSPPAGNTSRAQHTVRAHTTCGSPHNLVFSGESSVFAKRSATHVIDYVPRVSIRKPKNFAASACIATCALGASSPLPLRSNTVRPYVRLPTTSTAAWQWTNSTTVGSTR